MSDPNKVMPLDLATALRAQVKEYGLCYKADDHVDEPPEVYAMRLPDWPANAICVYVSGGPSPSVLPTSSSDVQIHIRHEEGDKCRGGNRIAGWYAQELYKLLHRSRLLGPNFWCWLTANHLPGPRFLDHNNTPVWSLNFTATGLASN